MQYAENTYLQFCKHQNRNVRLTEYRDENGNLQIRCKCGESCALSPCVCIQRLKKSIEAAKKY